MKKIKLAVDNDNVVYVRGIRDGADPVNADGSPKYLDSTVTWELLDAGGLVLASGVGVAVSTGFKKIELADTINYNLAAFLHVNVVIAGGYEGDCTAPVEIVTRTGANVLL